jgi:hypothetical protein
LGVLEAREASREALSIDVCCLLFHLAAALAQGAYHRPRCVAVCSAARGSGYDTLFLPDDSWLQLTKECNCNWCVMVRMTGQQQC